MPAVRATGLGVRAGGRELLALPALDIRQGERVAVIGPNGAGKSTLLRCLSGFAPVDAGQLTVLGRALHAPLPRAERRALRCEVGQVLQGLHLVGRLDALDNTLIGTLGRLQGLAALRSWARRYDGRDRAAAASALARVGLAGRGGERVDRLSGGERQRVAMARLLMQRPRLILADEPTASLDPTGTVELCRILSVAAQELGATLVTVVHQAELLPLLADRVVGLRQGRLVFDRPTADLDAATLTSLYATTP
ncbi:MAG: ATP-binding cassette domain-containing protein [Rubrivivax sp.]|jgi:phosphonate transport system ATP-binding protein|nr:ATP-binding cassette domain-containing protein [Rubrivivax sp.]